MPSIPSPWDFAVPSIPADSWLITDFQKFVFIPDYALAYEWHE